MLCDATFYVDGEQQLYFGNGLEGWYCSCSDDHVWDWAHGSLDGTNTERFHTLTPSCSHKPLIRYVSHICHHALLSD